MRIFKATVGVGKRTALLLTTESCLFYLEILWKELNCLKVNLL